MAIKFVDRVPTYPNRIKFTAEDGTVKYGVWERADSPTVVGTPINAANLNAMQESSGLSGNVTIYVSTTGSDNTGNGTSGAPYATINKAINTIPKHLNGFTASVFISAGVYNEDVLIKGFSGGEIFLTGTNGAAVVLNSIYVSESYTVRVLNIAISLSGTVGSEAFYARNSTVFFHTKLTSTSNNSVGVSAALGCVIYLSDVEISQKTTSAIRTTTGSEVIIMRITGSDNAVGFGALSGSTIKYGISLLSASIMNMTEAGSRIYSGAQTSIPNY